MKNPKHEQAIVAILEGERVGEARISIPSRKDVFGIATRNITPLVEGNHGDVSILDGATEMMRPLDLSITETSTNSGFSDKVVPVKITNPGDITVRISVGDAIPQGEKFKAKVILFYDDDAYSKENYSATTDHC
ncbi:hypothetical protein [Cochleicola gelatinilyticus]|uniref:Uncharacterized protein n=1 Tax=Cochleicola gelatinilyticus TaxID=1763537 RepID=A0A167IKE5_9FLAO|nr:hypothetical protein [Cochleicola gelatinilyticus]OAB79744.1 hypothetical protein ULVI_03085 [Cochleicola gelatinilyticus]